MKGKINCGKSTYMHASFYVFGSFDNYSLKERRHKTQIQYDSEFNNTHTKKESIGISMR